MSDYYAYILSNKSQTLYTGVTNDLARRVDQRRNDEGSEFTAKYNCHLLVWYQRFSNPRDAIAAEKKIKGWTRAKKVALIEERNPEWLDLSNPSSHPQARHPERSEGSGSDRT